MADELTIENRREILQHEINSYVKKGYRVISQTDTTAQLVKPKKFSLFWAIIGILIIYLLWYLAKRDKQIYIEVTLTGKVITRK